MFIKELEIKGNTRLMIRGTSFINLKFTETYQIVLGTNGCGKSTLIQELSPLPPQGADYLKNGYKKVVIEHNSKSYTLVSRFTAQAGKHSFIDNQTGDELNQGGTQSVQRTLIQEIFTYDQALHDVLTDQIKFTNMSPLQRRDWLTRISGTNLDYAIELFNKLRRAHRDEEAVVKHLTKRLNKESDSLPSSEDLANLENRFNNLDNQLKDFYSNRINEDMLAPTKMSEIVNNKIAESVKLSQELLRCDFNFSDKTIKSIEHLNDKRSQLQSQMEMDAKRVVELYKEHTEISDLLTQTQGITDEAQLQKLKDRLDECKLEIKEYERGCVLVKECDNAIEVNGRAISIGNQLLHIATEFVDNTEGYFTKDKRLTVENDIATINLALSNYQRTLREIEHNISHIMKTDESVCPKCNHTFKAGVKDEDLPILKTRVLEINTLMSKLEEQKLSLVGFMDEYTKYRNNYIMYMDILNQNRDLDFLKVHIRPIDLLQDAPSLITKRMSTCLRDLDKLASVQRLMPEVYRLEAAIDKVNSVRSNGNYTQERLIKIEDNINEIKQRSFINKDTIAILDRDYDNYTHISQLYIKLDKQLTDIKSAMDYAYKSNKKYAIESMITKVNTDFGYINVELNEAKNKQNVINDVSSQRDITMRKSDGYKLLVSEINPTTGLIADYFKQFIDQFVEQMNIIINKVWEHHIELLPCDVNSDGISYKFPLRVNDKPYGPPDGSKGSNSQVSMVNFAFKIVVMVYLGLDDYPLYLDELAPDLDEKHRVNIIAFVRDFVESKRCSECFMVSHYATGYGAFTNAEILVLDDENLLDIPPVYNKHAVIKKDEELLEELI